MTDEQLAAIRGLLHDAEKALHDARIAIQAALRLVSSDTPQETT